MEPASKPSGLDRERCNAFFEGADCAQLIESPRNTPSSQQAFLLGKLVVNGSLSTDPLVSHYYQTSLRRS